MFSNEDYLAELLTEAGLVSADQVAGANNALSGNQSLIEYLLAHTSLTESDVAETLAANAGIQFLQLGDVEFEPSISSAIPGDVAKRYRVVPVMDDGTYLTGTTL